MEFILLQYNREATIGECLRSIYGISYFRSKQYCNKLGLTPTTLYYSMKNSDRYKLNKFVFNQNSAIGGDLKKKERDYIKHNYTIKSYKGLRQVLNLPLRGQNTKNNAKTKRWKQKK